MEANRFGTGHLSLIEIPLLNPEEPRLDLSDDNEPLSRARFDTTSTRQAKAWLNDLPCSVDAVHGQ